MLEICFQFINQDSVKVTPVYIDSFQLFMIFTMFLSSIQVRGVFLDIFEAFDRVRHKGLLYKVKGTLVQI